jgi:hypothetical protein
MGSASVEPLVSRANERRPGAVQAPHKHHARTRSSKKDHAPRDGTSRRRERGPGNKGRGNQRSPGI